MNLYLQNYKLYTELVNNKRMILNVNDINISNYDEYYNGILNLMKDTIGTEFTSSIFITVMFNDDPNCTCDLSIPDFWLNLIMWNLFVSVNKKIEPKYLFFEKNITRKDIKKYIDTLFIQEFLKKIDILEMNSIIDNTLYRIIHVDNFSWYLCNTINLEDFIELEKQNANFYEALHPDLSKVKVEDVKAEGMKIANKSIEIIMNSDHGLANLFRANEGVNKKQYKETCINIGTKPDGKKGVFAKPVNNSFINGGVNTPLYHYIESSNGRTSQIIVKENVGDAGNFARLLGLNNSDTFLNKNKNYCCDTKNFLKICIKDEDVLHRLKNRYYRFKQKGIEYKIDENDTSLIGKTILLRSPMTCASAARGEGVCYKCYGDLAYINKNINIGKIASELLSADLTQKMLSAKHLLEACVIALKWNKEFKQYFDIEYNIVKCKNDVNFNNINLVIDPNLDYDNDENDEGIINSFSIMIGEKQISFSTQNRDDIYMTPELYDIIDKKSKSYKNYDYDDVIVIPINELKNNDIPLFAMRVFNNDLNVILKNIKNIINNKNIIADNTKESILQLLLSSVKQGGLGIDSVHLEIILSNQIRDVNNTLEKPDWSIPEEKYNLITLGKALADNPSIIVSLANSGLKKALTNPLSYQKSKPSYFDLFYMVKPQKFLTNDDEIIQTNEYDENGLIIPIKHIDNDNLKTVIKKLK